MQSMEWRFVWAAYGLTWVTIAYYTLRVNRRARRAGGLRGADARDAAARTEVGS